jgi:Protein of unknown function (DUF1580)
MITFDSVFYPLSMAERCRPLKDSWRTEVRMIDVSSEKLLSFSEAAKTLPHRVHLNTLHRWRLRGIKGTKLETVLVGGRRMTSVESLHRFIAKCSGDPAPSESTPAKRRKEIDAAERELDLQGA